jgi:hypothetical protein
MKTPSFLSKRKLLCALLVALLFHLVVVGVRLVFGQSTGTISGRVINMETGMGIFGATVSANGPSQQVNATDPNGYYTISGLAPGPYVIVASASGYLSQSYMLFVYETANPSLPNFRLHLLSIMGRVYVSSTPSIGIVEANVTIGGYLVLTNSTGHYEILDLSDGSYTVTATAPGYTNESQLVTVSAGVSTVADFGLSQVAPGTISGTVIDSSTSQGLYQATVKVSRGSFEKLGETDQNGEYTIENVPTWPFWTIDAYKTGYVAQSTTTAVQSEETSTLDFALTPFGIIDGTVKDQATDQPVAGALVKADSEFLSTTNSSGHYTMFVLAGRYTVTASAPGYASESRSNVRVSEGEATTQNFALETIPPGGIIGSVADAKTGSGIAGATVTADGHTNTTDANGNYILSSLPSWTYNVTVSASGYASDSIKRTVPSGGSITADFMLAPYTRVHLKPHSNTGNVGQYFNLNINISEARFIYRWEVYLWWNSALLNVANVAEEAFLKGPFGNRTTELSFEIYPNEGVIHVKGWSTLAIPDDGVSGNGTLATMTLQIKAKGACNIDITNAMLFDPKGFPMFPSVMEGALFETCMNGGCPFVYVWNGVQYVIDNNLLPASESSEGADVEDYYRLEQTLAQQRGKYSLMIKEFEQEHSYFDQVKLIAVDHEFDLRVAVSPTGEILTYRSPHAPFLVEDGEGNSCLDVLTEIDGEYYEGRDGDYIVLDFADLDVTDGAKLVLVTDLPPLMMKWSIHVQTHSSEGEWMTVAEIHPRVNWATQIVDLSDYLPDADEELKVRLYFTANHKIDFVGLDLSKQADTKVRYVTLVSAIHSKEGNVKLELLKSDSVHTELLPGEQLRLAFTLPKNPRDARTFIIFVKGHYNRSRN